MKKNTITSILVKPKREGKFIYYINENLDNGHYADRDQTYQVIADVVPIQVAQEALQLLREYSTFFVDVQEEKCYEFELDYGMALNDLKTKNLHPNANNAKKQSNQVDTSTEKWYTNLGKIFLNLKGNVNSDSNN